MRTADKWADSKDVGGGTVQSKKAEREELARKMSAFEKANGAIEPTPILMRADTVKRITKAEADKIKSKAGDGKTKLTQLQIKVINRLSEFETVREIARSIGTSHGNVDYAMRRLVAIGLVVKVERGVYKLAELK